MTRTADTPTMKAETLFTFFVNALHCQVLEFLLDARELKRNKF